MRLYRIGNYEGRYVRKIPMSVGWSVHRRQWGLSIAMGSRLIALLHYHRHGESEKPSVAA